MFINTAGIIFYTDDDMLYKSSKDVEIGKLWSHVRNSVTNMNTSDMENAVNAASNNVNRLSVLQAATLTGLVILALAF